MESALRQANDYPDVEFIVVVDGATDETLSAARRAASGYEEIVRIVFQENLGASAARNRGLELASGKYIAFLDADDLWHPGFLATVIPHLLADPDLMEFDACLIDEKGDEIGLLKIASVAEDDADITEPENFLTNFRCYAWARIYRTSMVRTRPFPPGRRFEDIATTPWHHWNSLHTISIGKTLISYRQHPQSVLATPQLQDIEDIVAAINEASAMYSLTNSNYWRVATHRIFQFACQRTVFQPFRSWILCARSARIAARNVPPPPGLARWLQANTTLLYIFALFLKRRLKTLTFGYIE